MILFLDIDGVMHELDRSKGLFSREEHLAHVIHDFPHVKIVVSSAWRRDYSFKNLKTFFLSELKNRIVGVTPVIEVCDPGDVAGSRHREILAYLGGSDASWLALDDDASLFPPDCAQLIFCKDGFKNDEELALRAALGRLAYVEKLEPPK